MRPFWNCKGIAKVGSHITCGPAGRYCITKHLPTDTSEAGARGIRTLMTSNIVHTSKPKQYLSFCPVSKKLEIFSSWA